MATNKNILMLRNWSLRKVIVINLLSMFISLVGFLCIDSEFVSVGLSAFITSLSGMLFYATFAVKAIEKDDKAMITSYIFIVALSMILLGFFILLGQYGQEFLEATDNDTALVNSPYETLMYFIMILGFIYGLSSVRKKYQPAWWLALLTNVVSCFGTFQLMFMLGDFGVYRSFKGIGSVLVIILLIILFFIEGKNDKVQTTGNTETASDTIPEQPTHIGLTNKGQELFKLKELLDAGILTQEEFDKEKAKILNS